MTSPRLLDRNVQYLKGVGPRRASALGKLEIRTARDLLRHGPHRYEDATTVTPIAKLEPGMEATAIGVVVSKGVIPTRRGLRFFQAVIKDSSGLIECSWPGQPFLDRSIRKGDRLLVSGPVRFFHGRQLRPREYTILARAEDTSEGDEEEGTVFPIYPATAGLTHRQIRHIVSQNLDSLLAAAEEEGSLFPEALRARLKLAAPREAYQWLHRPPSLAHAEKARRRLAFDELFILQVLYARARYEHRERREGIAFERQNTLVRPFADALPFQLTSAQTRVLSEIGADMASAKPMNRLLQGDVGSGKTVVAVFALLRAIENGYQAALMVPTELLADQHYRTVTELLGELSVQVELLRSGLSASERRKAIERIQTGTGQLVIGTHALIQEGVEFERLGLVVIDEQHRFGVRQRMQLRQAGTEPHVLVMSATPIPRSLALTFYGDLDISIIDEVPPGRQPVKTVLRSEAARARVFDFVRDQIASGRQAYVVYPVIEESEVLDVRSATEAYELLSQETFSDYRVALIHGRMPGDEKDSVMRRFVAADVDVLVTTTVIEVGIDVPNATVMFIEHPERFGLAQLHQLRGRVGRGTHEGHCILLADDFVATGRLKRFASTSDGFRIAELDLKERGIGELAGTRQSGGFNLRYADLLKDGDLIDQGRRAALDIIAADPSLSHKSHKELRKRIERRYERGMELFRVG